MKRLPHHGHNAFSPIAAGHGRRVSKLVSQAHAAVDFIAARDLGEIVLIGHSASAIIIGKAVEAVPDRVRRLVYLDAIVFKDGESSWHPRMSNRLGDHRFLQITGSHKHFLTNPNGLADKIIEADDG